MPHPSIIITNPSTTYSHIKNIEKLMAKIDFSPEKKISDLANESFEKMKLANQEKNINEYFNSLKKYCFILDLNKNRRDMKNCDDAYMKFSKMKKQDVLGIDTLESLENLKNALNSHIIDSLQSTLMYYINNSDILNVNKLLNINLDLYSDDFFTKIIDHLTNILIQNFNDLKPSDNIYFTEFDEKKFNKEEFRKLLLVDITSIRNSQNLFNEKEVKKEIKKDLEEYEEIKKNPEKQQQIKELIRAETIAFDKLYYAYTKKLNFLNSFLFRIYPLVKDQINFQEKIKMVLLTQNTKLASVFLGVYNFNEKNNFLDFDEILAKCIQKNTSISIKFIESYLKAFS
jgi:hypothetical protein